MGSNADLVHDCGTADISTGHCRNPSLTTGLCNLDVRLKIVCLLLAVSLNVVVAKLWLSTALLLVGLFVVLWSRVPLGKFMLFFLAPAWATLVVFLGFSVGFGTTPVWTLGPLTVYAEGLHQGVAAATRVACDMTWLAAIFLTTSFNQLIHALKWFRVPDILVDTIAMAYRYAFLIYSEFKKMQEAAQARGGFRNYKSKCRSTARILAQILLRAFDRSKRIQLSMMARGEFAETVLSGDRARKQSSCPNSCDITPDHGDASRPVLVCRNVTYIHNQKRSIKDISLTVSQGEVVVLCGPNGAGKTTLLRLIAGLLTPEKGEILLGGNRLDRQSRNNAFQYVGLMAQDPNDQLFCTHVKEDIAYGPIHLGLDAREIDRRVTTAMALMEVTHLAHRPIHNLSHGEMKRVGLAGIIAMQPPLILLDEPTASLDPASANHLIDLIDHLNRHHGYTLVVVTHDIDVAARISKRMVILNDGHLVADGPKATILKDEKLLERCRLEPPILTTLFRKLQTRTNVTTRIPITIEEAIPLLQDMVQTREDIVALDVSTDRQQPEAADNRRGQPEK